MNKSGTFASRLNQLLQLRGLTKAELSRRTGISRSSITHYAKGDWEGKQDAVYAIADATGVNEAWLMGYDVPLYKAERTPPAQTPKILKVDKNAENNLQSVAKIREMWSQLAKGLEAIKQISPEAFEKEGISLTEVEEDIAKAEDWVEVLTSILILQGFSEEGAKKVAAYADDILPRYRAKPRQEGRDTTPAEPPSESPVNGE